MIVNEISETQSLDGDWQVTAEGETHTVNVPGVWDNQDIHGTGPVIYRRTFTIPAKWRQVHLYFGAVSYFVSVRVNEKPIGVHEGLWAAFAFDITDAIYRDRDNVIELEIIKPGSQDDTYSYRETLVGFIPYVSMTFGGPWQSIILTGTTRKAPVVESLRIMPQMNGEVSVSLSIADLQDDITAEWCIFDPDEDQITRRTAPLDKTPIAETLHVSDAKSWSPESPECYVLRLRLLYEGEIVFESHRRFGFRRLHANSTKLLLNDTPLNLRGVLSWGWNSETLAPVFSDDEIRDEFRRVREMGFNCVKLCLFVPEPRYFEIADEEGMLLWLELPLWLPHLTPHLREQARIEYAEIMAQVHYHPSLVLYSLGCELDDAMDDLLLLQDLERIVRRTTSGALICDNSGSSEAFGGVSLESADYYDYHFYSDLHYFNPLVDHFDRDWRTPRPWIFGEFCDSDDFRDIERIGHPEWLDLLGVEGTLERWAYSEQATRMAALDLAFTNAQIVEIARRESFLTRKFVLEQVRLRRFIGGYVITGLRDTPVTTSGIFDDFNQPKFQPEAFRQFNADTVLLLGQGRTRRWINGGDRPAPFDLFNHRGGALLDLRLIVAQGSAFGARWSWRITSSTGDTIASNTGDVAVTANAPQEVARIQHHLPQIDHPETWTITAELAGITNNHWQIYVYPDPDIPDDIMTDDTSGLLPGSPFDPARTGSILLTRRLSTQVETFAHQGGKVILWQERKGGLTTVDLPFWRESIKLLYDHPVLERFPHDGYVAMQFYHLATDYAFAGDYPANFSVTPVIQRLDARLFTLTDYLVDLRVGDGRILATTLNLAGGSGDQVIDLYHNLAGGWLLAEMIRVRS